MTADILYIMTSIPVWHPRWLKLSKTYHLINIMRWSQCITPVTFHCEVSTKIRSQYASWLMLWPFHYIIACRGGSAAFTFSCWSHIIESGTSHGDSISMKEKCKNAHVQCNVSTYKRTTNGLNLHAELSTPRSLAAHVSLRDGKPHILPLII